MKFKKFVIKIISILGAVGFRIDIGIAYEIRAKYVIIATGGASGLYRPNNPGFSRHKMWYSPFNTGLVIPWGFVMVQK